MMERAERAPRVSIAFPVFDGARTAQEALDSLAAQTYRDLEILIFDNASTDRTAEICQAFVRSHPNASYHRNAENLGAARNYNLALHTARGEFFKWMACDDVLEPDFVRLCVETFDRAPADVALVFPRRDFIDPDGRPFAECSFRPSVAIDLDGRDVRELSYRELVQWPHGQGRLRNIAPAVVFGLMRRDVALRTRGIGGFIGADLVFNAEMALQGRLWQIPELLWHNRMHAEDSWRARLTKEEQARWYDPRSRKGSRFREAVLVGEYARSVMRLEKAPAVRARRLWNLAGVSVSLSRRALQRRVGRVRGLLGGTSSRTIDRAAPLERAATRDARAPSPAATSPRREDR